MVERETVIDKLRLTYEGLFVATDLYQMIDNWFRQKAYDKRENKNIEKVTPDGKYIEIELEPWKKITDYARIVIKIRLIMNDVKEIEMEKDGLKVRMNQGKVHVVMDSYLETDYENRWEGSPVFYFIRVIFDKFIFKPLTGGWKSEVVHDTNHLYGQIRSFLNLYKFSTETFTAPRPQYNAP
ncbi:MAG TPA: hypothetical protein VJB08_06225 [Candidatus Nanoarchaeia archaeon]|nr:hypothetical protein [Candidatus Nanoarchaeia archaeon]